MAPITCIDSMSFAESIHVDTSLKEDNTVREAEISFMVSADFLRQKHV